MKEQEIFSYVKRLANFRKKSPALTQGKLTQFVPENGIYVYFRTAPSETIMVIMNTHNKPNTISLDRYQEAFGKSLKAENIITGSSVSLKNTLSLKSNETLILKF